MILKILKSKWFWIGLIILIAMTASAFTGWQTLSKLKQEATQIRVENEKLKNEAKVQEDAYRNKSSDIVSRDLEIVKRMQTLISQNQQLVKENIVFQKRVLELEKLNEDIKNRLKNIKIPDSRTDRVNVFRSLGY